MYTPLPPLWAIPGNGMGTLHTCKQAPFDARFYSSAIRSGSALAPNAFLSPRRKAEQRAITLLYAFKILYNVNR